MHTVEPIRWTDKGVVLLDQRRLPGEVVYVTYTDYRELAQAITDMVIRGAPAIGVAAAMGVAMGAQRSTTKSLDDMRTEFVVICETFARTRPTAVDLFWAIDRFRRRFEELAQESEEHSIESIASASDATLLAGIRAGLVAEAQAVHQERRDADERIGRFGAELLPKDGRVMTQCNAGALATGGIGTALGVIRMAVEGGYRIEVLVPETRPYLQGARLTAWELARDGFDVTLITDSMVAQLMRRGGVDLVVVGADRVARSGDVANKIGTYGAACLAHAHGVPFYVAAPWSTVDLECPDGAAIPIEQRHEDEVRTLGGVVTAPPGVRVDNPAFDVTPARLVTALFTERGEAKPPSEATLRAIAP